jgi:PAT family beta-lactamase induction signal transducer AmpG
VTSESAVLASSSASPAAAEPKRRSPLTWVNSLYFAQGLPFFAVNLIAQQMFVSGKVPTDTITHWMGILSLAWGIRWLWSPLLELAPSQKGAVIAFQWLGAMGLALVAFSMQLTSFFPLAVAALFAVSLLSATHDVSSDGIYMAQLNKHDQAKYAGWRSSTSRASRRPAGC